MQGGHENQDALGTSTLCEAALISAVENCLGPGQRRYFLEQRENMYIIIQISLTTTATLNTHGGPHPAGSVLGAGTMSHCPLHMT